MCFHTNFRIICFSSVKTAIGILIAIVLNLWKTLGSMIILTLLILSVHKYVIDIYFHLFIWSLVTFISVSFASRSFTSLDSLIPRCFIFFDATANMIFFLISVSSSFFVLSIYKYNIFLYINLKPTALQNFISSANIDSFISSFQFWILCAYFYCLIVVARTSNTLLNKSGEICKTRTLSNTIHKNKLKMD